MKQKIAELSAAEETKGDVIFAVPNTSVGG